MRKVIRKSSLFPPIIALALVLLFSGGAMAVPDGILTSGGVKPEIGDALKALRISVNLISQSADDLAHGDVAPIANNNPIGDGKIDIGDALAILRKVVNLVNWNIGAPLKVADKVSVVDAKDTGGVAPLALIRNMAIPFADLPSDSAYKTDQTAVYVNERSTEAFKTVNEILCMISQTSYDAMLNKGPYKALINKNLCEGNDSASNAGQSQQGDNSGTSAPDYMAWTVDATRLDDSSPQIIKAWVHSKEQMGPGQEVEIVINARMTITEPSTADNPYGIFELDFYADPPPGFTLPPGQPYFAQGFMKSHRDNNGKVLLDFIDKSGPRTEKAILGKDSATSGNGAIRLTEVMNDPNTNMPVTKNWNFDIAFNDTLFHRTSPGNDDSAKDFCFDRDEFETSAWRYGLYDSDTGARINVNSGFPIKATLGGIDYFGWIGYWGFGLPAGVTVPDNTTIHRQIYEARGGSQEEYTVIVKGGKLKKHSKSVITLADIINIPLEGSIPDPNNQGPSMTMNRLTWDGSNLAIRATAVMDPNNPPNWEDLPEPNVINDQTHLPFGELSFWAQSLGGQVRIELSGCSYTPPVFSQDGSTMVSSGFTTCATPTGETPVAFYREEPVYPGDSVPATFACYDNCPKAGAAGMDPNSTAYPMSYNDPNAASRHDYTFGPDLVLKDQGNPAILATAPQGQQWGFSSGPLFDPSLVADPDTSPLACDWTDPMTGIKSICGWKAWSALDVFYTWETGPNNWNRLTTVVDSLAQVVKFDPPLRVEYVHSQTDSAAPDYKYAGVKFFLDYSGFGNLQGIPGKCVDMNSGSVVNNCNGEGIRWVPEFTIPAGSSVTATTGGNTATYYVKPLEMEQRMKKDPDPNACSLLSTENGYDFTNFNLNDKNGVEGLWQDPAIGAEPSLDGAPAVIGGIVQ